MIITIDGPAGTGKSTIAKLLAKRIGFIYLDTGAMYRCVTYALLKKNINSRVTSELSSFLDTFFLEIRFENDEKRYFYEGEDVSQEIRRQRVTSQVSALSAIPEIREKLVAMQRQMATGLNTVVEGRDMGTVVFPKADLKIFLTGRPEVRARRRFDEIQTKYPDEAKTISFDELLVQVNQRDHLDSTRSISPLIQASDAHAIDTSDLSVEEIIDKILMYKQLI